MTEQQPDDIRAFVRERYADVARKRGGGNCCGGSAPASSSCCGGNAPAFITESSLKHGYTAEDGADIPAGADMGLGCGNPQAIAALQLGETVLDLGSGGGFDCFLAARRVGPTGKVIGVDMTPEMVLTARRSAVAGGYTNVDFRLGEIEALPVADGTVDIIMSNCVINLSPEKGRVYREAYRVLKPGGRLAISDVVALKPLPPEVQVDLNALASCLSVAATAEDITTLLTAAGFTDIRVALSEKSREMVAGWAPGTGIEAYVCSGMIEAVKG